MCILIHHPINTRFGNEQLQDFFHKNPDGFGAIVKRGDTVEVLKSVGTLEEIIALYDREVAGHEAVIHFRMKTHGEIDLANCHPYEVMPGLWMAHNGILSTGNAKDPKMSDTYHYINDFLRPLLERDPDLLYQVSFQKLVAGHIGSSNKFAFMDSSGRTIIINEASGINHEGVWYSNTYAWTPYKFGYGKPPVPVAPYRQYAANEYPNQRPLWDSRYASSQTWKTWDKMDREMTPTKPAKQSKRRGRKPKEQEVKRLTTNQLKSLIRSTYNVVQLEGYRGAIDYVVNHPMAAMKFIYEIYGNERSHQYSANAISNMVNHNPDDAAELLCEIWEEMEPELCELAEIDLTASPF